MSLSFRSVAAACLLAVGLAAGCSPSDEAAQVLPGDPPNGVNATVRFADQDTLKLAPRQIAEVTVLTDPPDAFEVSFLLVGETVDASLDHSTVRADASGRATVKLRAPNEATSFTLRAAIKDGGSAELGVAVSDLGFGSLEVEPVYMGNRATDTWQARVVSKSKCAALAASFPDDPPGSLIGSAPSGEKVGIDVAPVGPNLAVFVRGGHFMWGCSDEPDLEAGKTATVQVHIIDKPIVTTDVELDVDFAFVPEPTPWDAIVQGQRALMLAAFQGSHADMGALLDDTMQQLSGNSAAYQTASNGLWAGQIQAHLDNNQIDLLSELASLSIAGMVSEPAELIGKVESIGQVNGQALYTLARIGSVGVERLGVPPEYVTELTVDAEDKAHLNGSLFWLPSRYIGAVIEDQAIAQTQTTTVFEALAAIAQCDQIATTLGGYSGCNGACMEQLCSDALAARWQLALSASADSLQVGEIPFAAAGASQFDDEAYLTAFEGQWLGEVMSGSLVAKVQGAVSAQPPTGPSAD
jgi:hypothetical protein